MPASAPAHAPMPRSAWRAGRCSKTRTRHPRNRLSPCPDIARPRRRGCCAEMQTPCQPASSPAHNVEHRRVSVQPLPQRSLPRSRPGQSGATATTFLPLGPISSVTRIGLATVSPIPLSSAHRFLHQRGDPSSSAGVSSSSAKAVGHMAPSSRFAASLKPSVA